MRHLAVTLVSTLLPKETGDLAKHMIHSEATQQQHYNDSGASFKVVRVSKLVNKVLTKKQITANDLSDAQYGNSNN